LSQNTACQLVPFWFFCTFNFCSHAVDKAEYPQLFKWMLLLSYRIYFVSL